MDRRRFLTNVGLGWLLNNVLGTLGKNGYSLSGETQAQAVEAKQLLAANSKEQIFGISPSSTASKKDENTTPEVVLKSSDIQSGQELSSSVVPAQTVDNPNDTPEVVDKAVFVDYGERLTGLTAQDDGTLIIATVAYTKKGNFSRLIFTDSTFSKEKIKSRKVSGFKKNNATVESIVATQDKKLLSIVSHNEGKPPFFVTKLDSKTGKLDYAADLPELPPGKRYSNLTQAPDGTIYASAIGTEGYTQLVQLDLVNKAIITGRGKIIRLPALLYKNETLTDDLRSLAVSSSGQIFALADPERAGTNSLFTIDAKTGEMTLVRKGLTVEKIVIASA